MSRLAYWKQRDLDKKEARAIQAVEQYGCHVLQVSAAEDSPEFSYSMGLAETLKCPEIVVMGLAPAVSLWMINEIRDRVRDGLELKSGLQLEGLLERGYACELRQVRPQWYEWLLGWTTWFYGSQDYPALQCVWPDKEHRFPWDRGFNAGWVYQQPMLDRVDEVEARMDRMIASIKRSEGQCNCPIDTANWPFEDDPRLATLTQAHVSVGAHPVLLVIHDEDGAWQMLDGSPEPRDLLTDRLHHLVDADPTLASIADLPRGWRAWRTKEGYKWHREVNPPHDEG